MVHRSNRTDKRSDVLVIGGGPSGLRVAARLAEAGLDVRVLERKPAVGRNVVCTGIVGLDLFGRFGLDPAPVLGEIRDVRLVSPFGTVLSYCHPRPFACVVDRERFDARLAEAAVSAGATLMLGSRVDGLMVEPDRVRVTVRENGNGTVRYSAAVAVIASGVDPGLARLAGLGYPRTFLRGAQVEVPSLQGGPTTIFIGRDVAPGAFAWSVPVGGRVRVGLLAKRDAKALLARLMTANGLPEGDGVRTRAVAQGLVSRTTGDRVLSVGEAAGQIKTTTGGGISYGLLCADLAAEAVRRSFERSSFRAPALAGYEVSWRKALEKEIVVGHFARRLWARLSDGQVEGLFRLAQTDGIIPLVRETADFDRHSGLIFALLDRLSFMKHFRLLKDTIGRGGLS